MLYFYISICKKTGIFFKSFVVIIKCLKPEFNQIILCIFCSIQIVKGRKMTFSNKIYKQTTSTSFWTKNVYVFIDCISLRNKTVKTF